MFYEESSVKLYALLNSMLCALLSVFVFVLARCIYFFTLPIVHFIDGTDTAVKQASPLVRRRMPCFTHAFVRWIALPIHVCYLLCRTLCQMQKE